MNSFASFSLFLINEINVYILLFFFHCFFFLIINLTIIFLIIFCLFLNKRNILFISSLPTFTIYIFNLFQFNSYNNLLCFRHFHWLMYLNTSVVFFYLFIYLFIHFYSFFFWNEFNLLCLLSSSKSFLIIFCFLLFLVSMCDMETFRSYVLSPFLYMLKITKSSVMLR